MVTKEISKVKPARVKTRNIYYFLVTEHPIIKRHEYHFIIGIYIIGYTNEHPIIKWY